MELKKLFAFLVRSDKKYADPTQVLKSIVDGDGNPIEIGEQQDIGEFNSNFLQRLHEGLNEELIKKKAADIAAEDVKMQEEHAKQGAAEEEKLTESTIEMADESKGKEK